MTATESLQTLRDALDRHAQSPDIPRLLKHWRDEATLAPLLDLGVKEFFHTAAV